MTIAQKAKQYCSKVFMGFIVKSGNEQDFIAGYKQALKDVEKELHKEIGKDLTKELIYNITRNKE